MRDIRFVTKLPVFSPVQSFQKPSVLDIAASALRSITLVFTSMGCPALYCAHA